MNSFIKLFVADEVTFTITVIIFRFHKTFALIPELIKANFYSIFKFDLLFRTGVFISGFQIRPYFNKSGLKIRIKAAFLENIRQFWLSWPYWFGCLFAFLMAAFLLIFKPVALIKAAGFECRNEIAKKATQPNLD